MKKIKTNVDILDLRNIEGITFKELKNGSYFYYEPISSRPLLCIKMIEPMYVTTMVDCIMKGNGETCLYKFHAVSLKDGVPIIVDEDDTVIPVDVDILVKEFEGEKK